MPMYNQKKKKMHTLHSPHCPLLVDCSGTDNGDLNMIREKNIF